MDYEDELPCGGYVDEDVQIKAELEAISLGEVVKSQSCSKSCGSNSQCKGMCECTNKQETDKISLQKVQNHPSKSPLCKKCKTFTSVLLHKNQPICKDCLLKNIQYKCRLTLENTIKIKPTSNVLLCFSGGLSSICLVTIMSNLKKRYQKNKLFGSLKCIHIQQQEHIDQKYQQKFKELTDLDLQIVKIEQIIEGEHQISEEQGDLKKIRTILKMFANSANTSDLIQIFRNRLIFSYAKANNFEVIMKGLNGESLASEIFKYLTKGIGGNLPELSSQEENGLFEFPLRQHLQKQLQYFYHCQKLGQLALKAEEDDLSYFYSNGLDNNIQHFISSLQALYSHTAPAILRTGEKIQSNRINQIRCHWCSLKGVVQGHKVCRRCLRIAEAKNNQYDPKLVPKWMNQI